MLLFAAALFVGNTACRPCHAEIAGAYARTPMARSSGVVDSSLPDISFTADGLAYRISNRRLLFDGGAVSIDYYIGSNSAGRGYLRAADGFLFELPVTWYAQKQRWDSSPGYDRNSEFRFTRAIEPSCLLCHSSQVRPVLGTQNRFGDPPFLENGISCERCHGPGSEHARNPAKSPMVNPAHLEAERRDSICSQCHLTGEARVETAGHRIAEYRAGDRLADYATYFTWKQGAQDFKVTSHVERLAESACKRASGDGLWCGTCHDVHTGADKSQAACTSCHESAHHREARCVTCHMPRAQVADANHAVMTDHRIPRTPAKETAAATTVGGELAGFLGTADDRAKGLAYAELGDQRAADLLRRAMPRDWPVRLRLAVLERDAGAAARLYESVLRDNPMEPAALVNLGSLYATAGREAEAGQLWERALTANPALEAAVLNLAKIRSADEARGILRRYLEVNPVSKNAKSRLAELEKPRRR